MAKNQVIAGDYVGVSVMAPLTSSHAAVCTSEQRYICKFNVDSYILITEDIRKSAASGVIRAGIGTALLGPIGLLAGLSAKNKGDYVVAINWKDGKQSLIEVDKRIYKLIVKDMF